MTLWTAARQVPLSFTISRSLLKFRFTEAEMPSNHLIYSHPLLLLPSIFSSIFSNESALGIRWPKYWSFSFNNCPSYEYLKLISFRIDWFDLHAIQGTLKSLHQHHNSKASLLRHLAFFMFNPHIHTQQPQICRWYTLVAESEEKWRVSWWELRRREKKLV